MFRATPNTTNWQLCAALMNKLARRETSRLEFCVFVHTKLWGQNCALSTYLVLTYFSNSPSGLQKTESCHPNKVFRASQILLTKTLSKPICKLFFRTNSLDINLYRGESVRSKLTCLVWGVDLES